METCNIHSNEINSETPLKFTVERPNFTKLFIFIVFIPTLGFTRENFIKPIWRYILPKWNCHKNRFYGLNIGFNSTIIIKFENGEKIRIFYNKQQYRLKHFIRPYIVLLLVPSFEKKNSYNRIIYMYLFFGNFEGFQVVTNNA